MIGINSETKKEKIIHERWQKSKFEWTPENTKRIIDVINGIDVKVNQMYDAVLKTKNFLDAQNVPDAIKKDYDIVADLTFERFEDGIPTTDSKTLEMLYDATPWKAMPGIRATSDRMPSRSNTLYLDLNWNIELFDRPELAQVKIPYYVHMLFVDSHTYTLNDMLYMEPSDFSIGMNVSFCGDEL